MFKKIVPVIILIFCNFFSQAQIPNRFEIVIDEIILDSTPQIGLPKGKVSKPTHPRRRRKNYLIFTYLNFR